MPSRATVEVEQPTCQCGNWPGEGPGGGRCWLMSCENPVAGKKHVICRPCAVGNHTGEPCDEYVRGPIWHLDRTCFECGFDSAAHPVSR